MTARRALLAAALLLTAAPAAARAADDLDQRIDRGQTVAAGRATVAAGHVDVGPRFLDGRWTVLIHDDAAASGGGRSVWRRPERTVLRVGAAALQQVPDDPAYRFLGVAAGSDVHVVPQTQDPRVVWVGWNTQDPAVMERIDRGVRMTLTGVDGPGALVVFLQSGDFGAPQLLWDSTARPRPVWVDVNTHTHANWVFTRPGVYLVHVRIAAELRDGTRVSDTRALRFAVGARASVAKAFAAVDHAAAADADAGEAAEPPAPDDARAASSSVLVAISAVLAVALAVALVAVLARGRGAKRRARGSDGR